jgi:hypothetical protein
MWRNADDLGIAFVTNRRGMMTSAKQEEKINLLKLEREKLQSRVRQLSEE